MPHLDLKFSFWFMSPGRSCDVAVIGPLNLQLRNNVEATATLCFVQ